MQADDKNSLEKTWAVFPLSQNIKKSACLVFFLLAICLGIYFSFKSIFYSFFSAILLIASLSPFFLPVKYELYAKSLKIHTPFRTISKDWEDFRNFYVDKNGIFLSPFDKPSRLENFRGIYLRFGQVERDELIKIVEQKFTASCHKN